MDCRDSFIHNIAAAVRSAGVEVRIVKEDGCHEALLSGLDPEALILSPGPGRPSPERGSWKALDEFRERIPVLGVCLGHQTVCSYFGASVDEGAGPMHGKRVRLTHDGTGLFVGIPQGILAVRYNSLCARRDSIPGCLSVDATDGRGDVMAVSHRKLPIFGVQFHPESFLTEQGGVILRNFIGMVRR